MIQVLYPKKKELNLNKMEDDMHEKATGALHQLAKGNPIICRIVTESQALSCFAAFLEKGSKEIQYNSAMALMGITAVAEHDANLMASAFETNSPACKAVIEQLLRIIEKAESRILVAEQDADLRSAFNKWGLEVFAHKAAGKSMLELAVKEASSPLLVPCIKAVGNLSRTLKGMETRIICPLVELLDHREAEVSKEAVVTLNKIISNDDHLSLNHTKTMVDAGVVMYLVQLVLLEPMVQEIALDLLCHIACNMPDGKERIHNNVLLILGSTSRLPCLLPDGFYEGLVLLKRSMLLHQPRG